MYGFDRKQVALIIVVLGSILFGVGYKMGQAADKAVVSVVDEQVKVQKSQQDHKDQKTAAEKPKIAVYVCGAVKNPGIYHLNEGARVADAVGQAVPLENADLININLAEIATDGQQIQLYVKGNNGTEGVAGGPSAAGIGTAPAGAKQGGKVNINRATLEDFDSLPGIGPSTAQKIIDYRQKKGKFKSIDELTNVTGIGEKKLESIKKMLTI